MKILLKLFSLKMIASLLGLLYSIIQVHYFGASRSIEIYFAAQSLVYLVTSLTQSGQLAEVFLPEYHKLENIEKNLGYQALNVVISRILIYGSILIAVVFIFAPFFINLLVPGFSVEERDFASLIFRVLLPLLYLQVINSFFINVLNAQQRFGRAEFLGLTNTIVNILSLLLLYPYIQLWSLVVSLLLGKFIEFGFYIYQLYQNGYRFKWILSIPEFDHKFFFTTMRSTLLYVGSTQLYNIVLTAGISFLPEGTYAIFKYVKNLASKIKGLFIQPFMTIFFTKYSLLLQKSKSVFTEFSKNMSSIVNVNAVTIIGTILTGDLIIELIWGGDKFDKSDVNLAYYFLLFNVFSILLTSIGGIYRKMVISQGKAKRLYLFWTISQLLSAVISFYLIKYFKITGLLFIIPINGFLLSIVSYILYVKTKESLKYNFLSSNSLLLLLLFGAATICKIFIPYYFAIDGKLITFLVFSIIVILLSLYPISSIYRQLKS